MNCFPTSIIVILLILHASFYGCGREKHEDTLEKDDKTPKSLEYSSHPKDLADPNSYIVMFRSEPSSSKNLSTSYLNQDYYNEYQANYLALSPDILTDSRIKNLQFITEVDLSPINEKGKGFADFDAPAALQALWLQSPVEKKLIGRLARVDFFNPHEAQASLKDLEDQQKIWFAEPNYENQLFEGTFETLAKSYAELKDVSWQKNIHLSEAYATIVASTARPNDAAINASPPIVAVLDTGLDFEHPLIKDHVWTNSHVGAAGCSDDLHGCDTVNPDRGSLGKGTVYPCGTSGPGETTSSGNDKCSHGTHVSGIIAATPDKSRGVGGVCPVCQIMTLKVVDIKESADGTKSPRVLDSAILTGMKYLNRFRRNGSTAVRVINSSFGKFTKSRSVGILVDVLKRDGLGVLLVGAAGNEDSMSRAYPAAFSEAVAVSALDNQGRKASYSNYGSWVDIAAPGGDGRDRDSAGITSIMPGGSTGEKSGTSMASPVVAGAVALYLAVHPDTSADQMRSLLLSTSDGGIYDPDYQSGYNYQFFFPKFKGETTRRPLLGSGLLNVDQLMTGKSSNANIGSTIDRVTPGCGMIDFHRKNGVSISILWLSVFLMPIAVKFLNILLRRCNR